MTPRSRESGFLAFLLGNPLMLLAAGLGIALVVAGISLKVQSVRLANAKTETAQAKGELAAFVGAVKQRGEEQEAENAKREKQWKQTLVDQRTAASRDRTALRAELERVRGRPVDPAGREIPVTTAPGPGPDGLSAKLVPLTQYESLQERSALDALQVTQLQDYIIGVCN